VVWVFARHAQIQFTAQALTIDRLSRLVQQRGQHLYPRMSTLEALAREITEEPEPVFAFSFGPKLAGVECSRLGIAPSGTIGPECSAVNLRCILASSLSSLLLFL
jgi:hypothetical protein